MGTPIFLRYPGIILTIIIVLAGVLVLGAPLEPFADEASLCRGTYYQEIEAFLSAEECDKLVEAAESRTLVPSEVGGEDDSALDLKVRRSSQTWFARGDHAVTDKIRRKTGALLRSMPECVREYSFEQIQVAKYGPGGLYRAHYDGEDCDADGERPCPKDQRIATLLVYLTEPEGGGATRFPLLDVAVRPAKGKALFFWVADPATRELFEKTLHGGEEVRAGTKYIANQWVRSSAKKR